MVSITVRRIGYIGIVLVVAGCMLLINKHQYLCSYKTNILLAGDVLIGDGPVAKQAATAKGFSDLMGSFESLFRSADIIFLNFEGTLASSSHPRDKGLPADFSVRSNIKDLQPLLEYPVLFSLANNHSLDFGIDGLAETVLSFNQENVPLVGVEFLAAGQSSFILAQKEETTFAFVAFTDLVPEPYWNDSIDPHVTVLDKFKVASILDEINKKADVVIVSIHTVADINAVPEFNPDQTEKSWSQWLVDHGADVVFNEQPHRLQASKILGQSLVFYSLGTFLYNPSAGDKYNNSEFKTATTFSGGGLVKLNFCEGKLISFSLYPSIMIEENSRYKLIPVNDWQVWANMIKIQFQWHWLKLSSLL